MHPVLFSVGGVELPAYLTMIMAGFFAALIIARRDAEAQGIDGVAIVDLGIWLLVLGVFGARILAVLTDGYLQDFIHLCTNSKLVDPVDTAVRFCTQNAECGFDYLCDLDAREEVLAGSQRSMCYPPTDCLAAFKFWQGGLTFYGGVLLALPGAYLFLRKKGMAVLGTADLMAPSVMLALALGRIGCFLNGCCYGARTESILGVSFPGHFGERHPTQLYESAFCFGLFLLLRHVLRKRCRAEGELFGYLLVIYATFRIAIEILRDDPRGALGPLSTSQLISIPLVLVGALLIYRARLGPGGQREV